MKFKNTQMGFTLIEVAIVMVIIGFMLASLLGPLGNRMEQSRIEQTSKQIDDILEAMYGFAVVNGRLPCPAIIVPGPTLGTEDITGGICNVTTGEPAWITLGTTRFDTWGQPFIYQVDADFTDTTIGSGSTLNAAGCTNVLSAISMFDICSIGNINIWTDSTLTNPVAQFVPAIVLSLGKQRDPSIVIADETENTDGDTDFVSRDFRPENAPTPFNDIVRWIPANVLVGKMVQAQRLP